jgi:hypothetical protein
VPPSDPSEIEWCRIIYYPHPCSSFIIHPCDFGCTGHPASCTWRMDWGYLDSCRGCSMSGNTLTCTHCRLPGSPSIHSSLEFLAMKLGCCRNLERMEDVWKMIDTTIYPTNSLILQSRTTAISSNLLKLPPVSRPQLQQQLQTTCQARKLPLAADQQHSRALAMWAKAQCSQHPARRISTILQRLRDEGQLGAKHRTGLELVMGRNYINDCNIL